MKESNNQNTAVVDELLDSLEDELKEREVIDLRVGLSYIGARLDDGGFGVSFSFRNEATRCCEILDSAGEIEGNAWELAKYVESPRAIDSSIGLATINSLINRNVSGEEGPLLDFLEIRDGDKVGMVGNFMPVVDKIEDDIELFVFERDSQDGKNVYPDWAVEQLLPEADISIITGTSVVNRTLDHLVDLSSNAREIAVLGPTTPLAPDIFREKGVTFLGGMVMEDADKGMKIISQGGGTRKLGSVGNKVSLKL
jgi:hypothetical protein